MQLLLRPYHFITVMNQTYVLMLLKMSMMNLTRLRNLLLQMLDYSLRKEVDKSYKMYLIPKFVKHLAK
jgi:hypothetical protein